MSKNIASIGIALTCLFASHVHAQQNIEIRVGVIGSCTDLKLGEGPGGKFIERLTLRPLLTPRDGTKLRRAVIPNVSILAGAVTLTAKRGFEFVDGSSLAPRDLDYSISKCLGDDKAHASTVKSNIDNITLSLNNPQDLEILRNCSLRQESSDAVFGDRAGYAGAFVSSGPFEPEAWTPSYIRFVRTQDEGRGPQRIEVRCITEAQSLIAAVRSGALEAVFINDNNSLKIGSGDETVRTVRCLLDNKQDDSSAYSVISRNPSISCIERLDPLAIIP